MSGYAVKKTGSIATVILSVILSFFPSQRYAQSQSDINRSEMSVEAAEKLAASVIKKRVNDYTGVLSAAAVSQLEAKLADLESEKGSQVVIVIVPTVKPLTIEEFSIKAAEAAKPGRKNADDGVIFLVALQDRRMRIEVGYGLEGAIPDARAKRIISEIIVPHFREGRFEQGIISGTDAIISLILGEDLPPVQKEDEGSGFAFLTLLFIFLFIIVFFVFPLAGFSSGGRRYRRYRSYWDGGFRGGGFGGISGGLGGFSGGGGGFGGGGSSGSW